MLLPVEVQSYIRHILHFIGMGIVAQSGGDPASTEMWVGVGVNAISLIWFIYTSVKAKKNS